MTIVLVFAGMTVAVIFVEKKSLWKIKLIGAFWGSGGWGRIASFELCHVKIVRCFGG